MRGYLNSHVPRMLTAYPCSTATMAAAMSPHAGQRRTIPAPRNSRCAPIARRARQDWQTRSVAVTSRAKTSSRTPAIAFPSVCMALASGRSKALGADAARVVPELDEEPRRLLHERRRPADVDARARAGRRAQLLEHR